MIVYWDTSALVAVYIADACSSLARGLYQKMEFPISSWLCFAETHAALNSAKEMGKISTANYHAAVRQFEDDWLSFRKIPVKENIAAELRRLFKHHLIRGADATHLATALVTQRHLADNGQDFIFACHDKTLSVVAEVEQLKLGWIIK